MNFSCSARRFLRLVIASQVALHIYAAAASTSQVLGEELSNSWWQSGRQALNQRLAIRPDYREAKNVILFIGDGMGISSITAGRILDGQSRGESGEENQLTFENFPNVALIKTYNSDAQVPDSAGTASAINTGIKSRFMSISIWDDQAAGDCYGPQIDFPRTLAEIAESAGMSTGFVTTDKVTYATPAAVYAHAPSRAWEDDSKMPEEAREKGCLDIAQQLVAFPFGDGLDVVMGGGRESLTPVGQGGRRLDGQNLIEAWRELNPDGHYVATAKELRALDSQVDDGKLLGIFSDKHLSYSVDKNNDQEPTLAEMTVKAIESLSKNLNGYFLMVENGHIDHANHKTNAYRALTEVQALARAVGAALDTADLSETLILVTADHSHPLTISGYTKRGYPILGLVRPPVAKGLTDVKGEFSIAADGQPYTTLGYRFGPNARNDSDPQTEKLTQQKDYLQQALLQMDSGAHSGEDVALYATGPRSHLVGGVLEQHVIFHIIAEALGWAVAD